MDAEPSASARRVDADLGGGAEGARAERRTAEFRRGRHSSGRPVHQGDDSDASSSEKRAQAAVERVAVQQCSADADREQRSVGSVGADGNRFATH